MVDMKIFEYDFLICGSTHVAEGTTPGAAGNNFANVIIDQLPLTGSLTLAGVAVTTG